MDGWLGQQLPSSCPCSICSFGNRGRESELGRAAAATTTEKSDEGAHRLPKARRKSLFSSRFAPLTSTRPKSKRRDTISCLAHEIKLVQPFLRSTPTQQHSVHQPSAAIAFQFPIFFPGRWFVNSSSNFDTELRAGRSLQHCQGSCSSPCMIPTQFGVNLSCQIFCTFCILALEFRVIDVDFDILQMDCTEIYQSM
ncbi:hypothetical protein MPTK1_7g11600 [Marchantia polymorpha subsp. ruderalis]|uniref:Uncharacterized protein n=2 Tax=Marchantia polymorpha TaxID=3197 RepID=A0AAF6BYH3_MARPO|nr:hypothetical protein MARPO_0003s0172 [Marchantia polymorpha]BBN17057.1 hypothetical protein Mp_7g11600 [Marchantia polymorpha subsp. ruderalis]|eukprot:PTQ49292.1 hypothetical protein MARPO_0003s0172 [Marchantia polymorpha]